MVGAGRASPGARVLLGEEAVEMKVNQNTVERVVRSVGGVALIAVGLLVVKGILGIVLGLVGAVLLFSGVIGFCHVYKVFHINTSKKR